MLRYILVVYMIKKQINSKDMIFGFGKFYFVLYLNFVYGKIEKELLLRICLKNQVLGFLVYIFFEINENIQFQVKFKYFVILWFYFFNLQKSVKNFFKVILFR